MARLPRLAVGGEAHYVLQIAHGARPAFADDVDRAAFVALLGEAASRHRVALHGYALLDHEVHLLATPPSAESLSRFMQSLARRYGAGYNRRHRHLGTVWAGRFRASVVDPDGWVLRCLRWLERQAPPDWRWSSARHHLGVHRDPLIHEHRAYWSLGNTPFEREAAWARELEKAPALEAGELLRAIRGGWPIGSEHFRSALASTAGRRVAPRRAGRPRSNVSPLSGRTIKSGT